MVSPKQVAFFFMPDFNIPGWMNTLEKYLQYDVDTIVFSHNGNYEDPLETGNQESVRFALKYLQVAGHHLSLSLSPDIRSCFKDLQKAVRDEFAAGTPAFEIFTKVKLSQYSGLTQYDNWFPLNVQAMVVNEVLGPLSWRSGREARALEEKEASAKSAPSKCFWRLKKRKSRFGRSASSSDEM